MYIDIHAHAYRYTPVFGCGFCTAEQLIEEFPKNELYEAERDMFKIKLDMLMLEHLSNK